MDVHAERTRRSIQHTCASTSEQSTTPTFFACTDGDVESALLEILEKPNSFTWFVRAGAWLQRPIRSNSPFQFPTWSCTGRPLCALGATRPVPWEPVDVDSAAWTRLLAETSGDLESLKHRANSIPPVMSVLLDNRSTRILIETLKEGRQLHESLQFVALNQSVRTIRWQPIDVKYDQRIRIAQVITSLQRGGAERVAIDLHRQFESNTHASLLVGLGKPTREPFDPPPQTLDLAANAGMNYAARLTHAVASILDFGTDIIHAHLLRQHDLKVVAQSEIPTVVTVHNMSPGWPAGLASIARDEVALLVACARNVESELKQHGVDVPTRTVWNGIEPQNLSRIDSPTHHEPTASKCNTKLFTLVSVANPRPQKRLELLPEILVEFQSRLDAVGANCTTELLLAGEPSANNPDAIQSYHALLTNIANSGHAEQIKLLGPVSDIGTLLGKASAMITTSRHEGLSLAHLEALSANVPVVATDVGGTSEIAHHTPSMQLVPSDATPQQYADKLIHLYNKPPPESKIAIERSFSIDRMHQGYERLFAQVLRRRHRNTVGGLLLVINNFSTGGAQSSARRLLSKLHSLNIPVRAAVLDETPDNPTAGRRALLASGIDVMSLPRAGTMDPLKALQPLLTSIDQRAPASIVFWNAIMEYKLLIADCIWDIPLFDVSPGEMYFSSMQRYFARPRPGLPYLTAEHYGQRLQSVIVKYAAERETAASYLKTNVEVVPNGVPIQLAVDLHSDSTEFLIGTVARISTQKKLEELIEAVRIAIPRMPPFRVQIVGGVESGSEKYAEDLKALSEGLPIDWMGEQDDPSPFLQKFHLFVLISEPAGCPNAGLEAMAFGLPMIATDVGGASEQVVDDENGFLVPRGDVVAIANALVRVANDRELRVRLGTNSHLRASRLFAVDRMVADYRRIFQI